jgi:phosphoglycerate dehydrogenase-like enzyme
MTPEEERTKIVEADVVVGLSIDESLLEAADSLRWFACAAAGIDHLPTEKLRDDEIIVTNASGVHASTVSEHVFGLLLIFLRRFGTGLDHQIDQNWQHYHPVGDLSAGTTTVVGMGAIGTTIIRRLQAFDVETIGVRHTPSKDGPADTVIGYDQGEFHDALSRSDHVVLACPLTDTTEGLLGSSEFLTLPSDAIVINVARGPVIDTEALVDAIRNNHIGAAGLDVTDPEPLPRSHPLWSFDDVRITPHVAGYTAEYWNRLADIVESNVDPILGDGSSTDMQNRAL